MRRLLAILLVIACLSWVAYAQNGYTTITAVVLDPTGAIYTNSQVSASFFDPGTSGKLPLINGSTFQTSFTGYATDSFGRFSMTLPDNGVIASTSGATGTQWIITICYSDRATCFQTKTPINCSTNTPGTCTAGVMDISAYLQSVSATLPSTSSGGAFKYVNLPFSPTPNFSSAGNTAFNFVLTGNVTTPTFLDTSSRPGTVFVADFQQDAPGGHTFAFPANVILPVNFTFNTAPSAHNQLAFWWNGFFWDAWYVVGAGGGGGSLTPAGSNGDSQCKLGSGLAACHINDNGTIVSIGLPLIVNGSGTITGVLTVGDDSHFRGPNPYVDSTIFHVRAMDARFIPAVPGITGTSLATSTLVTVSTSSCTNQAGNQCFANGDGFVGVGMGPSQSMAAPTPTVTPSIPSGPTGTTTTVPGPAGGSGYNYKVIAVDKGRGMTVAGTTGSTATGQASLGPQSKAITSCTRTGTLVNCLTAAHQISAGSLVYIALTSDGTFAGWYQVANIPDNTHFTFNSGFDTKTGASTSTTGGTVNWQNENLVSWSHVANAHQYIVCSDRGGAGFVPIGISKPDNTASSVTDMALSFDDLGSPTMDGFVLPFWAGANPCTAASPQNDELVTTIVSGAPGTALVLANAASTSVTGGIVLFDNGPTIIAAAQASIKGPLNIPLTTVFNGTYPINSYTVLPGFTNICQLGDITVYDTIQLVTNGRYSGSCPPVTSGIPTFAWKGFPIVNVGPAYPGFYQATGNVNVDSLQFNNANSNSNQKVLFAIDQGGIPGGTIANLNFTTGSTNDLMGMGLVLRGGPPNSISGLIMTGVFQFIGGGIVNGSSTTPLFYSDDAGIIADYLSFGRRGMAIKSPSSSSGKEFIKFIYINGSIAPLIIQTNGGVATGVHLGTAVEDTVPHPLFVNLNSATNVTLTVDDLIFGPSFDGVSIPPLVSGLATTVVGPNSGTGYSRNSTLLQGAGLTSLYPAGTPFIQSFIEGDSAVSTSHSFFVSGVVPAAPTSPGPVAGGSVPVGNITYKIVPVWKNGGEGLYSPSSAVFATTPGNQTINLSWTAVPGNPIGYDIYRNGALLTCSIPNVTTNSFSDTLGFACGQSQSTIPTGGPTMMLPGIGGVVAPNHIGGGFSSVPTSTKTSAYTPTINDNIIPVDGTASGFTVSLNPAIIGSHWVLLRYDNVGANTITIAPTSGSIDGTSSTTISPLTGMIVTCDGINCHVESRSIGGGPGTISNAPQFSFPYYCGVGSNNLICGISPPGTNSVWKVVYQVVGGVPLAPTVALDGIPVISMTGNATLDFSYRAAHIITSSCTTPTLTLPAISGTIGVNLPFTLTNGCSGDVTVTSTSPNNINGGSAGGSVVVHPGWFARFTQDNTPNWSSSSWPTTAGFPSSCTALTFSTTIVCATLPVVSNVNLQTVTYTAIAGDNGKIISMNGSSITLNLPASPPAQPWGIYIQNTNASSLTVNRNGLNIDGAASNITVPQNQGFWLTTDGSNYFTARGLSAATAGVSSFTGDGTLLCNTGSTGAVTDTLCNAGGFTVWGKPTSGSGAPSYSGIVTGQLPAVILRRVCTLTVGDTSGSAITNAQLGPQKKICFVPAAATVLEVEVTADAGTPNVIVGRNRAGSTTNLLSGALATAASGAIACSNTAGTTGFDGTTTCSSTLQNTATNAGDFFELVSGTAGGTAKLFTVNIVYAIN